jgi:hypothetical protein
MMRPRIDDDLHVRAAAARTGDHLLAGCRRGPVVGTADED